ncbi:MAG TPA: SLBB domain-containing protein [Acidobacteriaceae bacterium]|nr:SLBB domain-containing protein [Acidobacteriaceae bacterium]
MPPGQIIAILQQNPNLADELRAQLADRIGASAADISDQMLYDQIGRSADLRGSISTVLRARGYAPEPEPQPPSGPPGPEDSAADSASAADPLTQSAAPLPRTRSSEVTHASTDLPRVISQHPPIDLQAMHDLYSQIPNEPDKLRRFGSDVFSVRGEAPGIAASARRTSLDVPVGPDYVLGPGDTLSIQLWGGYSQTMTRTVGRDGRVFLPEAGSVTVAGLPLGRAQTLIEGTLQQQYRSAHVAVTVAGLRSIRIYVVGDVQRPGGYDISSLATPLSAFYLAGGPTAVGSLRTLLHYRGDNLIEKVDLYDFLLHGMRHETAPFQSGDTLLVPPAGPQIAIDGAVRRPAIYELGEGEATLANVIDDAGGLTAAASTSHISIERIDGNQQRETLTVQKIVNGEDPPPGPAEMAAFRVRDGDRIRIDSILPYSQRAIYLVGHVVRPGRVPYINAMRLSDVLHSYQDMLPEPASRGEIVRLVPPDLHAEVIDFDVPDVLIGNRNVDLQPFDTVRIFGRYEVDAPTVTIRGEVLHPGSYPMSAGMTAAQLVRLAGGFRRDALLGSADLTSYEVQNGKEVLEKLRTVRIGDAVAGSDANADVLLRPGDILAVHQITNWDDIGESVKIQGEVRYPGSYGFRQGERLSSVLRRAGGLLPTAYPVGAVLVREQVRDLEQSSRDELVRQIETNSAAARLSPGVAGANAPAALQLIKAQQDEVLQDLKNHPPTGRMVIHISADIDAWANTPADVELRQGDVLTIPKRPGFVLVTGQVYNATALAFTPGKTAAWYLSRAGGANPTANRKEIFIIRANGSVVGHRSGQFFQGDVLSTRLEPGDVIVVPQKIIGGTFVWRNLLAAGQVAASAAITAGVAAAAL